MKFRLQPQNMWGFEFWYSKINYETGGALSPIYSIYINGGEYIESNLSKIDKLIALQQNKLTQLTALKKYLLQKLFI